MENMTKDGNDVRWLYRMAELGYKEKMKAILKRNTPDCVLIQNEEGATPAHIAAQNRKWAILVMLLEKNMDCATIQDKNGTTILHIVAKACDELRLYPRKPVALMKTISMILKNKPECSRLKDKERHMPRYYCDKRDLSGDVGSTLDKENYIPRGYRADLYKNSEVNDMLVKAELQTTIPMLKASLLAAEEKLQALDKPLNGTKPASRKTKRPALIPIPPGMKGKP